jgi:hypothetical protein
MADGDWSVVECEGMGKGQARHITKETERCIHVERKRCTPPTARPDPFKISATAARGRSGVMHVHPGDHQLP